MVEINGISHVSLTVRDLERSERWYSAVLGMHRILEERHDGHDWVLLRHSGSGALIGLHAHAANDQQPGSEFRTGLDHIGFAVGSRDELDEWAAHFAAHGVEHSPVVDAPYGHGLSFRDPDNIPLELFSPVRGS